MTREDAVWELFKSLASDPDIGLDVTRIMGELGSTPPRYILESEEELGVCHGVLFSVANYAACEQQIRYGFVEDEGLHERCDLYMEWILGLLLIENAKKKLGK